MSALYAIYLRINSCDIDVSGNSLLFGIFPKNPTQIFEQIQNTDATVESLLIPYFQHMLPLYTNIYTSCFVKNEIQTV